MKENMEENIRTAVNLSNYYMADIKPAIEPLITFISELTRSMEMEYAGFTRILLTDPYHILENSRGAIVKVVNQQLQGRAFTEYLDYTTKIKGFCDTYAKQAASLFPNVTPYDGSGEFEMERKVIQMLRQTMRSDLQSIISLTDQMFLAIYKFPYIFFNYKTISNTINTMPDITKSAFNGVENNLIAFQVLLFKLTRSTNLFWVNSRGTEANMIFIDEDIDQIRGVICK